MLAKTNLVHKYLELLKKSLVNELYIENEAFIVFTVNALVNKLNISIENLYKIREQEYLIRLLGKCKDSGNRIELRIIDQGDSNNIVKDLRNLTELSHTMIGKRRLDNIQYCMETVLDENIPGDMIETGIWRGGATIFMRGVLEAYGITDRVVWAADSFEGVPSPTCPEDNGFVIDSSVLPVLAVSLEEVMELFERYDLLDEQVNFVNGWFKDTLKTVPIDRLALLRLDGDLYESTMDALNPLYRKVSKGGFVIVDDYFSCPPCKLAIDEFRATNNIYDELIRIDDQSVFWRKSSDSFSEVIV